MVAVGVQSEGEEMNGKPISFRMCDFSEQIVGPSPEDRYSSYSAVMHVDGEVFQWRKSIRPEFCPPLSALRSEGWLALLEQISEKK